MNIDRIRREFRTPAAADYPELQGYSRTAIYEGKMGPGGLYLSAQMSRRMHLSAGQRVLDLGCGGGATSVFLAKKFGVSVVAIDLVISATEKYRRFQQHGVEDRVVPLNLDITQELPFAHDYFDAVFDTLCALRGKENSIDHRREPWKQRSIGAVSIVSADSGFEKRVIDEFGDRGEKWLSSLPDLLSDLASAWHLTLAHPVGGLNVNYVCYCTTADDIECVLKVGVPHFDLTTEIEALEHYDGRGVVRALRTDPERHALLLERIRPARRLHELGDNREESRIAARVIQDLVRPAPEAHNLPDMVEKIEGKLARARRQLEDCPDFPAEWIGLAEEAVRACRSSAEPHSLLHGDLHHGNILYDARRGWIGIDPKGFVGPACLEVGRFTFNFLPVPIEEAAPHFRERISILSEELEDDRIQAWAMVDIVQCLCSTIGEREDDWKWFLLQAARLVWQHVN